METLVNSSIRDLDDTGLSQIAVLPSGLQERWRHPGTRFRRGVSKKIWIEEKGNIALKFKRYKTVGKRRGANEVKRKTSTLFKKGTCVEP